MPMQSGPAWRSQRPPGQKETFEGRARQDVFFKGSKKRPFSDPVFLLSRLADLAVKMRGKDRAKMLKTAAAEHEETNR